MGTRGIRQGCIGRLAVENIMETECNLQALEVGPKLLIISVGLSERVGRICVRCWVIAYEVTLAINVEGVIADADSLALQLPDHIQRFAVRDRS